MSEFDGFWKNIPPGARNNATELPLTTTPQIANLFGNHSGMVSLSWWNQHLPSFISFFLRTMGRSLPEAAHYSIEFIFKVFGFEVWRDDMFTAIQTQTCQILPLPPKPDRKCTNFAFKALRTFPDALSLTRRCIASRATQKLLIATEENQST